MKKVYVLFFSCSVFVSSLYAQLSLPIYEPFASTPLGTLAPQNSWTGPTGADQGAQVVDSSLGYNGLSTMSSSYAVKVGNQPFGAIQQLVFTPQTTQVYASFLIRLSVMPVALASQTSSSTYVAIGNAGTGAGCMYAFPNEDGTTFELGFSSGANVNTANANKTNKQFQLGDTILVVMAFTPSATGTGGTGSLNVWVNPPAASLAPGASEPTPNFLNRLGSNATTVNNVHLRSGAGTRSMIFDELRVGNSWSDITSANVVLPVSLVNLKLTTNKTTSTLAWTSKTEDNFSKYVVMFSLNGTEFSEVGTVLGKGSNSQYLYSHSHIGEGFFKLKMVDLDGRFAYSKVLHANAPNLSIKVGPNPVADRLYINGMPEGTNTAVLYTMTGSSVKMQTVNDKNMVLSLSALPAGSYVLRITNNSKTVQSTVVIK